MLRKGLVIYEPKGRAREYAELACNLYRGCGHQCIYCYAPRATFQDRASFANPEPRKGVIEQLQKDAARLAQKNKGGSVLLCFSTDPYQPINDLHHLTRRAILILHSYGFDVTILTKGGERAARDFNLLRPPDEFATTLTFLNEAKSRNWEPYAALPQARIDSLKKAYSLGITTWVSLEPVIEPAETFEIIRQTHTFVDLFKVGKLNYRPEAEKIDWHKFAKEVINILEQYDCKYYIKKDLRRFL